MHQLSFVHYQVIEFLISENIVKRGITIKEFRRKIHDYGIANASRFAGETEDGSDAIFKFADEKGSHGYFDACRKSRNVVQTRLRSFKNSMMLHIYHPRMSYKSCSYAHYMDGQKVIPIIMHCYKPSNKLVLYESNGSTFITDIYSCDKELDAVFLSRKWDNIACASGPTKCLFFERQMCHHDVVNNKVTNH
mmetsp:Transcript_23876/g.36108  ORF Transcript_23876/g.36108 Transcript_23876/m.36108 type:complete len:192 (+) Transcript_23876:2367-2942(+)|eukprot:CAMPEP_0194241690 /NCGR_PEP_ID=MMETSP0158-20130606/7474_1 /TAXON_ID=33649 /ORGANISM="Thalassionema nitzschioides, Strain L26-B" /LENGTH=191 /DNA_ID=CAMNT_0038976625 /DNA_START=199 /DNA_END=774 /DNA_ORIENTATION=-